MIFRIHDPEYHVSCGSRTIIIMDYIMAFVS